MAIRRLITSEPAEPGSFSSPVSSSVRILGVRVDALTYADLLARIAAFIAEGTPHQIATVNPEFVMEARRNPTFAAVLEQTDLCLADGVGLLWAARRMGQPLPERVTGSDGVPLIAQRAAERGWGLYLLGAGPGVAQRTGEILQGRYPGLRVVGAYAGSPADADAPEIIARIRETRPDILFVAYGAPKQDLWIGKHRRSAGCAGHDGGWRLLRLHRRRPEARAALGAAGEPGMVLPLGDAALAVAAAACVAAVCVGGGEGT